MLDRIGLITIITGDIPRMKRFYTEVLGFECIEDLGNYVEFRNKGIRFALTTPEVMYEGTEHSTYREERKGQSFELAFPLLTVDDVGRAYDEIVAKGATAINAPEMMPWGRMTAFFADPDGNIHELYSLREGEEI
jgi:catechol 2,3-dioxygenase-like lactoylglutathione lyase family enzyme